MWDFLLQLHSLISQYKPAMSNHLCHIFMIHLSEVEKGKNFPQVGILPTTHNSKGNLMLCYVKVLQIVTDYLSGFFLCRVTVVQCLKCPTCCAAVVMQDPVEYHQIFYDQITSALLNALADACGRPSSLKNIMI